MYNRILITGIGGPAGKGAVTYLREKEFNLVGTDIKEVAVPVNVFYIIPPAGDPAFSTALLDIIKKERPGLLIPTVTEELPAVSRLKNDIEKYGCTVFISPPAAVEIANDKMKTVRSMARHGIPVPISFDADTPKDRVVKKLGLPLLSKPCFGRGGRGVKIYNTPAAVYREAKKGLIFQEFIPGEEYDINLFIDRRGDVLACVVLKKTLLKDGITGNALAVERVEKEDIAKLGIKVAQLLNMEGPVDMDVRLKGDGTPMLLEINARIGGNILSAREIMDSLIRAWKKEEE